MLPADPLRAGRTPIAVVRHEGGVVGMQAGVRILEKRRATGVGRAEQRWVDGCTFDGMHAVAGALRNAVVPVGNIQPLLHPARAVAAIGVRYLILAKDHVCKRHFIRDLALRHVVGQGNAQLRILGAVPVD